MIKMDPNHLLLILCLATFLATCHEIHDVSTGEQCADDGVVGTFGQKGVVTSLTVTANNFKDYLELHITKNISDIHEIGIQVYINVDDDSSCTKSFGKFEISHPDDYSKKCLLKFEWDVKDHIFALAYNSIGKPMAYDGDREPFIASFEIHQEDNKRRVVISNPVQGPVVEVDENVPECFKIGYGKDGDAQQISFKLTAKGFHPAPKEQSCGIQLEMKGIYFATKMIMDGQKCTMTCPGCTNPDSQITPTTFIN